MSWARTADARRGGRKRGSHHEIHRRIAIGLAHGQIHLAAGYEFQSTMPHVTDHADDAPPVILVDNLPDGILAGPECTGEGLIDEDDRLAGRRIAFREIPARAQRDPHGVQIAIGHDADKGLRQLTPLDRPDPCALTPQLRSPPRGRYVGEAGRLYARDGGHAAEHFGVIIVTLGLRGISAARVNAHGGCAFRLKAKMDIENAKEACEPASRADEENTGEGDLRNNQRAADPGVAACPGWNRD